MTIAMLSSRSIFNPRLDVGAGWCQTGVAGVPGRWRILAVVIVVGRPDRDRPLPALVPVIPRRSGVAVRGVGRPGYDRGGRVSNVLVSGPGPCDRGRCRPRW